MRNPPNHISGGPMGRMMGSPADHMNPMNRQRLHGHMNIGLPLHMDGPPLPPGVMNSMLQVMCEPAKRIDCSEIRFLNLVAGKAVTY